MARFRTTGAPNTWKRSRFPVAPKAERTIDGIVFASKREASRYAKLKLLEKAKEITDLVLQPKFPVLIAGQAYCTYTADFSYRTRSGARVIEDVKSKGTQRDDAYRLRKKAAELFHGIQVKEVIE